MTDRRAPRGVEGEEEVTGQEVLLVLVMAATVLLAIYLIIQANDGVPPILLVITAVFLISWVLAAGTAMKERDLRPNGQCWTKEQWNRYWEVCVLPDRPQPGCVRPNG